MRILFLLFCATAMSTSYAQQSSELDPILQKAKSTDTKEVDPPGVGTTKAVQTFNVKKSENVRDVEANAVDNPQRTMELYNQMKPGTVATTPAVTRCVPSIKPNSDGQVEGFKCLNIKSGSFLKQIGLQDGDLITAIDGKRLDSPSQATQLLSKVESSKEFSEIQLIRNGTAEFIKSRVR